MISDDYWWLVMISDLCYLMIGFILDDGNYSWLSSVIWLLAGQIVIILWLFYNPLDL